jgi:hypothetical protein
VKMQQVYKEKKPQTDWVYCQSVYDGKPEIFLNNFHISKGWGLSLDISIVKTRGRHFLLGTVQGFVFWALDLHRVILGLVLFVLFYLCYKIPQALLWDSVHLAGHYLYFLFMFTSSSNMHVGPSKLFWDCSDSVWLIWAFVLLTWFYLHSV